MTRTIRDWQREVHELAKAKGWHPPELDPRDPNRSLALLMLITTEVAEAAEDVRLGGEWLEMHRRTSSKPVGLPSELADIVIRVLDMAGALGIDMEEAIAVKHAYNATREHRHGGKRA